MQFKYSAIMNHQVKILQLKMLFSLFSRNIYHVLTALFHFLWNRLVLKKDFSILIVGTHLKTNSIRKMLVIC